MAQPMYQSGPGGPSAAAQRGGGTPKIVPVLVSMGVAIGTFCGLYFGLGTKKDEAAADPNGEVAKADPGGGSAADPGGEVAKDPGGEVAKVDPGGGSAADPGGGSAADPGGGSAVDPGAGSAKDPGAGSAVDPGAVAKVDPGAGSAKDPGAGSAAVPTNGAGAGAGSVEPAMEPVTLQFSVVPPTAEVTMDGKPVEGGTAQVELTAGKKVVKIVAKADGFRTFEKKFTITGDQVISFKMTRRGRSSGSSGGTGPGDKIDLGKIDM